MPSVLVYEDGTGIADANTTVTVADVVAYCAARNLPFPAEQVLQEATIIEAGEYLMNEVRYAWRGTKQYYDQSMPWPRVGAVEFRGLAVPSNTVPWRFRQAQMYLSYLASLEPGELERVLDRGGKIKTKTIGPISTTYMDDAPVERIVQKVQGFLQPLLQTNGYQRIAGPIFEATPLPSPDVFQEDVFNNPGSGT